MYKRNRNERNRYTRMRHFYQTIHSLRFSVLEVRTISESKPYCSIFELSTGVHLARAIFILFLHCLKIQSRLVLPLCYNYTFVLTYGVYYSVVPRWTRIRGRNV